MDISINWIKDFVDLPEMDTQELGTKYTLATCEVEGIREEGKFLEGIIAAEIVKIDNHPDSDHLHLVTIEKGNGQQTVVCGAPNVAVGMKVPFAPLGTTFPGGFTLVPKKIRGVESEGMLCSEEELGLGEDNSGLMSLAADTTIGTSMAELFNIDVDTVIDIDNKSITHRPDLWGHYGQAREFALVFDTPLKDTFSEDWKAALRAKTGNGTSPIVPKVEDSCCKAYYGLSVDGVKVAPSPTWMQNRLKTCGIRPINNIVDISNYVMLELGIPMHIFDRDRIKDETIIIKRVGEDSPFVTLDEEERQLLANDTVVADSEKPLVIAGIMGGLNSGVLDTTDKIFIEVANWVDAEVRKTSTRIGLRTDSSQRYEKSLDSQMLERTMLRALELVLELCPEATVVGSIEKDGPETGDYTHKTTDITCSKISTVLGKEVAPEEIVRILEGLSFGVERDGDNLHITVPSFRATKDVEYDADIIEEIGRIIGFDNIEAEPTYERTRPVRLDAVKEIHRKIQDFLVMSGNLLETMTYPMVGEKLLKKAEWNTLNEELQLVNALSNDADRMRPSLIPSICEMTALNSKNFDSFSAFELGRTYLPGKKAFSEEHNSLAIMLFDKNENRFMELVNLVERLIRFLNIPAQVVPANEKHPSFVVDRNWKGLHPNENLDIKIMGRNFGLINTLHPTIGSSFKIKGNLAFAVIDLSPFEALKKKEKVDYKPLPKFPSSTFDCTVVVPTREEVVNCVNVLNKLKLKNLESAKVVDIFKLSEEEKAVTLRATFLDREKTLKHEFLEEAKETIVSGLAKAGYALKM